MADFHEFDIKEQQILIELVFEYFAVVGRINANANANAAANCKTVLWTIALFHLQTQISEALFGVLLTSN